MNTEKKELRLANYRVEPFMINLDLSPKELHTYALLYSFTRGGEIYYGSKEWLAKMLKFSVRTVYRVIDSLSKKGLIKTGYRKGDKVGIICIGNLYGGKEAFVSQEVSSVSNKGFCEGSSAHRAPDAPMDTACEKETKNEIRKDKNKNMNPEIEMRINMLEAELERFENREKIPKIEDPCEALRREYAAYREEKDRQNSEWDNYVYSEAFKRALERTYGKAEKDEETATNPHNVENNKEESMYISPQYINNHSKTSNYSPPSAAFGENNDTEALQNEDHYARASIPVYRGAELESRISNNSPHIHKNSGENLIYSSQIGEKPTNIPTNTEYEPHNPFLTDDTEESPSKSYISTNTLAAPHSIKSGSHPSRVRAENPSKRICPIGKSIHGDEDDDDQVPLQFNARLFGRNSSVMMTVDQYKSLCRMIDEFIVLAYIEKLEKMLERNEKTGFPSGPRNHYKTIRKWILQDTAL